MARNLTASDRSSLIRLASTMPAGSVERRAILAGLKKAYTSRDDEKAPYEKGGFIYLDSTHTYTDEADAKSHADAMKGAKVKGVEGVTVKRDGKKVTQSLKIKGDLASVKKQDEAIRERAFNVAFEALESKGRHASLGKTSSRMGVELFKSFVDTKKFLNTLGALGTDRQSQELLQQVRGELMDRLTPDSSTERALNRLSNLVSGSQDPANLRNQIFKVANELGIRLPSSMF